MSAFDNARVVHLTGTATVVNAAGVPGRALLCAQLNPGSTASSLTLYDNTSAAGTIILIILGAASTSSVSSQPVRVPVSIGIHAVLAGTGATAEVWYE